jgi:hypothetical protein
MAYSRMCTAIATEHALQLTDAIFQLLRFRITDNRLVRISRPGTSVARNSAQRLIFCSVVHLRRRTSSVSNSTCLKSLDISLYTSLCLSHSAYTDCPVEMDMLTTLRDLPNSRQIVLMYLPCTRERRIFEIVSTTSIQIKGLR